jgi:hypothetical protein
MKEIILAIAISHGADTASTLHATRYGGVEANPLIVSTQPVPFIAQMTLASIGEIYLLNKLKQKKPKLAKILTYISFSVSSGASINNMRVAAEMKRRH